MLKRVLWWAIGAAMGSVAGAAGSSWAQRRIRRRVARAVQRLAPPQVAGRVRLTATQRKLTVIDGLKGAVDTGRRAAGERELELRDRYALRKPQG